MNREIKFRGKRVGNGEWVYGYYVIDPLGRNRIYLQPFEEASSNTYYFVTPETVGQYTGLKDKDGKEIYEGDLVKHDVWNYPFEVIFNQDKARFVCKMKSGLTQYIDHQGLFVTTNIHDNPELINQNA